MVFEKWYETFKDNNTKNRNIGHVIDKIHDNLPEKLQKNFEVEINDLISLDLRIRKRSDFWAPELVETVLQEAWAEIQAYLVKFCNAHSTEEDEWSNKIVKIWNNQD